MIASGTAPPNMPECTPWSRVVTVTTTRTMPAQGGGEGRLADRPVGGVGEDDGVGAQLLAVPLEDRRQRVGADLLLALDEDRHADRQRPVVRAQRGDVGHDAGLVVGGAAAVEAAVALGRLERRAVPQCVVAGRLHVVVGVEHARSATRAARRGGR